eukprot:1158756-Pelagomonas_calceolata.AAC.10
MRGIDARAVHTWTQPHNVMLDQAAQLDFIGNTMITRGINATAAHTWTQPHNVLLDQAAQLNFIVCLARGLQGGGRSGRQHIRKNDRVPEGMGGHMGSSMEGDLTRGGYSGREYRKPGHQRAHREQGSSIDREGRNGRVAGTGSSTFARSTETLGTRGHTGSKEASLTGKGEDGWQKEACRHACLLAVG